MLYTSSHCGPLHAPHFCPPLHCCFLPAALSYFSPSPFHFQKKKLIPFPFPLLKSVQFCSRSVHVQLSLASPPPIHSLLFPCASFSFFSIPFLPHFPFLSHFSFLSPPFRYLPFRLVCFLLYLFAPLPMPSLFSNPFPFCPTFSTDRPRFKCSLQFLSLLYVYLPGGSCLPALPANSSLTVGSQLSNSYPGSTGGVSVSYSPSSSLSQVDINQPMTSTSSSKQYGRKRYVVNS